MNRHREFTYEERVDALAYLLRDQSESIDAISRKIGISAEDIRSKPLANEGFGDSEMLGFLMIHQGPIGKLEFRERMLSEFRGDWQFFSGYIRGYHTPWFLEWRGSVLRKLNYLALCFKHQNYWIEMYEDDQVYVSPFSPIKIVSKLIFYCISFRRRA